MQKPPINTLKIVDYSVHFHNRMYTVPLIRERFQKNLELCQSLYKQCQFYISKQFTIILKISIVSRCICCCYYYLYSLSICIYEKLREKKYVGQVRFQFSIAFLTSCYWKDDNTCQLNKISVKLCSFTKRSTDNPFYFL